MFPIRDSLRPRRFPLVVAALVVVNIAAFWVEFQAPAGAEAFVLRHGVVPARLVAGLAARDPAELLTVLSSMFLHGDLLHLLGNLWFLWVFGDNVEDRFGRGGFLLFYLVCGAAAAASQVAMDPTSAVPMIGASGAVAGVLGAYLRLYPTARVLAVVPIFVFLQFVEVRAVLFLGLWFLIQVGSSLLGASGVAWWAHIAGFLAGIVLSFLVPRGGGNPRRGGPPRPPAPRAPTRRR